MGVYRLLHNELRFEDPEGYKNFLRMDEDSFTYLLNGVKGMITKSNTVMRESIPPELRY